MEKPPKGLCDNYQSRAMYAIDLMLDWREENNARTIEPMICEINYMPDCKRACQYHPNFFNDVFNVLFLNESDNSNVYVV
jgi:tubulin--tyrosine ligase-like protein 12